MHSKLTRRTFLEFAGAAAVARRAAAQPNTQHILETGPAGKMLKAPDGRTILGYLTRKPDGVPLAGNSACCIHPLNTPNGERVTDLAPEDHRDHRGIFFAWHNMDFKRGDEVLRADFWGWGRFAPTEDRAIVNRDLDLVSSTGTEAEISVRNEWMIAAKPVMTELTTIRTRERSGVRIVDLGHRFTSDYDVTVNRMAFTGFCFRCRKDGEYSFADPGGEVTLPNSRATEPESDWPSRAWYSHTVALTSGKTVSAAVIDHPRNPPSAWHGARGVSFLNPCISALKPVTFAAGTVLVLRYRAVVADGRFKPGLLDELAAEWRAL